MAAAVAADVGTNFLEKYGPDILFYGGAMIVVGGVAYWLYDEYVYANADSSNLWGDSSNAIYQKDKRLAQEATSGDCGALLGDPDIAGFFDDAGQRQNWTNAKFVGQYQEGPPPDLPNYDDGPSTTWEYFPPLWGIGALGKLGIGPFSDKRSAEDKARAEKDQQEQTDMANRRTAEAGWVQNVQDALDNPACYATYKSQLSDAITKLTTAAEANATAGKNPVLTDADVDAALGSLPKLYRPQLADIKDFYNSRLGGTTTSGTASSSDSAAQTTAFTYMKIQLDTYLQAVLKGTAGNDIAQQLQTWSGGTYDPKDYNDILTPDAIMYYGRKAGCSTDDIDTLLRYVYIQTMGWRGAPSLDSAKAKAPIWVQERFDNLNVQNALGPSLFTSDLILAWCYYCTVDINRANTIIYQCITAFNARTGANVPPKQYGDYSTVKA